MSLTPPPPEVVKARVRRFATLRAAQRTLRQVARPEELQASLEAGRKLMRRMRALSGGETTTDIIDSGQAVDGVDSLLEQLADAIREGVERAPLRMLCDSMLPIVEEEPGSVRSLAAVVLEGEVKQDTTVRLLEYLVTQLSCSGPAGDRQLETPPVEALPELSDREWDGADEERVFEAKQIFARAVRRIDEDDVGAARDRIRAYKTKIGPAILHPSILEAAVIYNAAMGNRLARLMDEHKALDAFAETLVGTDEAEEDVVERLTSGFQPTALGRATHTRLFWQSAGTVGVATALLFLAVKLWVGSSVEELNLASQISPHLVSGYVSRDDQSPRFVGVVAESWQTLPTPERRRVVARISARLEGEGVPSVTLVDSRHAVQARQENDELLWITPSSPGTSGGQ